MMVGEYIVQQRIRASYPDEVKDGASPKLKMIWESYYVIPKEKFVRKNEKLVRLEKKELAVYEIPTPYTIKKVQKSSSRLGSGMRLQTDDLYITTEWEVNQVTYDLEKLKKFIDEKILFHQKDITP